MDNQLIHNIKSLMLKHKANIVQLAEKTGIPQPTLSRILNGTTANPRTPTLSKIADFFDMSLNDLCHKKLPNENSNFKLAPIIELDQINQWLTGMEQNTQLKYVSCKGDISNSAFAIEYKDEFPVTYFKQKQTILIFEPQTKVLDGDIALIKLSRFNDIILRQVIVDVSDMFMKSLNPELNIPGRLNKLNEGDNVIAILVQVIINTR